MRTLHMLHIYERPQKGIYPNPVVLCHFQYKVIIPWHLWYLKGKKLSCCTFPLFFSTFLKRMGWKIETNSNDWTHVPPKKPWCLTAVRSLEQAVCYSAIRIYNFQTLVIAGNSLPLNYFHSPDSTKPYDITSLTKAE